MFQVTKGLKEEIFNLKLQLNSSKQMRASLELQLCRKEEIILKTSDQLAKYAFLYIFFLSIGFSIYCSLHNRIRNQLRGEKSF